MYDMRSDVQADPCQYGGIKASSVDHLLVDAFECMLGAVDAGDQAIVLGLDYEKAFNRLDHNVCLDQLTLLGASPPTVALVRSFLTSRSMRVRLGNHYSREKPLSGGSPQGSILGCQLYCMSSQQIGPDLVRNVRPLTDGELTPDTPPDGPLDAIEESPVSDDGEHEDGMMLLEDRMAGSVPSPGPSPPSNTEPASRQGAQSVLPREMDRLL